MSFYDEFLNQYMKIVGTYIQGGYQQMNLCPDIVYWFSKDDNDRVVIYLKEMSLTHDLQLLPVTLDDLSSIFNQTVKIIDHPVIDALAKHEIKFRIAVSKSDLGFIVLYLPSEWEVLAEAMADESKSKNESVNELVNGSEVNSA